MSQESVLSQESNWSAAVGVPIGETFTARDGSVWRVIGVPGWLAYCFVSGSPSEVADAKAYAEQVTADDSERFLRLAMGDLEAFT